MRNYIFILFGLLAFSSASAQLWAVDTSLSQDISGPDTLYYPFRNGEQLIAIDYVNYYEQLARQLDFGAQAMSIPPSAHAYRAMGNVYFFRDTIGHITRVFNTSLSTEDVRKFSFRSVGYVTPHLTHNRLHQHNLYNGNTAQMHRQNLPDGYYRVFNVGVVPPNKSQPTGDLTNISPSDVRCGLIDSLGNSVLPMDYVKIFLLDNNFFVYKKNKGWGMLNRQLDTVVPFAYNEFMPKYNEQDELLFILFKKTIPQGYGLIYNVDTQKTYELDGYQNMYYIPTHNTFVLHKSRAYGMLDAEGNVTIPVTYSGFKIVSGNKIVFSKGPEKLEVLPK